MLKICPYILTALVAIPLSAYAADLKIAVVAPHLGNLQILGKQVLDGAALAAQGKAEIVAIEEPCTDGSGFDTAEKIKQSGATVAIGFLCSQSLEGGLPVLAEAKIPAITLSVRASILMEDALKKGWPLFRLAPSPTAERDKIADVIFQNWKGKPFAILDDGTITSRETSETVREALEQKGMKATLIDNFRPAQEVQTLLLRRLAKAGVTHVFAPADRSDMSVMAHDAKGAGLDLTFLGGDTLNATEQALPLEKGVLAITRPDYQTLPAAGPAVAALAKDGKSADGYVLPAYAAVTIAIDAQEIASGSGAPLAQALVETPFETVLGNIRFTKLHELATNPFALLEWDGQGFKPPAATQ
ncbi:MAG: receptor ligand binding region family protein [Rhizobium sp.]|nr:receptor ligand binding region family protein [Rhizobium sp.]